jgi:NADH:ubiquinone reductase (H+-translocating)
LRDRAGHGRRRGRPDLRSGPDARGDRGSTGWPHVVVVGGGFGGLEAVKALSGAPVNVTLVDRRNFHLFQPLTYQVATGALTAAEIAAPLRWVFRGARNVRVLMGEVTGFDLDRRCVLLAPEDDGGARVPIPYDTLIVAGGSAYSYFGHDEWRPFAPEVKSLESALEVRRRILRAFERAELETEDEPRRAWLTFVVVGAGPTGVELAGQIGELARDTLPRDFRATDPARSRILLVEMADRVLATFPPRLSASAARALEELGVTPLLGHTVVGVEADAVSVRRPDGAEERIPTHTVIWAAGVTASPLAAALAEASGAAVDRAGRVSVQPDLTLPGHPEVMALGDMVRVGDTALPGLAPVAKQQGRYAARLLRDRMEGRRTPAFRYRDQGNLATIGRARAVADLRAIRLSGFGAWLIWLVVHIVQLVGFQNRLVVLTRWAFLFMSRGRGARLITRPSRE